MRHTVIGSLWKNVICIHKNISRVRRKLFGFNDEPYQGNIKEEQTM